MKVNSTTKQVDCKLTSAPMINAVGIFLYAQHGYKTSRKKAEKQKFVNLIMSWEHPMLTNAVAEGILSGKIETRLHEAEGEVEFTINEK